MDRDPSTRVEMRRFLFWKKPQLIKIPARVIGELNFKYFFPNKENCWRINVFGPNNLELLTEFGFELNTQFGKPVHVQLSNEKEKNEYIPYDQR